MKTKIKSIFKSSVSFVLIAAMALTFTCCGRSNEKDTSSRSGTEKATARILGEGSKEFNLTVTDKEGNGSEFVIKTDKKTVGEALFDLKFIDNGEYVKVVNGITADYDKDKTFWGFYIDGKMASKGVGDTEIKNGETYELKVSR